MTGTWRRGTFLGEYELLRGEAVLDAAGLRMGGVLFVFEIYKHVIKPLLGIS